MKLFQSVDVTLCLDEPDLVPPAAQLGGQVVAGAHVAGLQLDALALGPARQLAQGLGPVAVSLVAGKAGERPAKGGQSQLTVLAPPTTWHI